MRVSDPSERARLRKIAEWWEDPEEARIERILTEPAARLDDAMRDLRLNLGAAIEPLLAKFNRLAERLTR